MDFKLFFQQYEALVQQAEAAFSQVKTKYPQEVRCKVGCSDCCHALFDLTLIEALYIKTKVDGLLTDDSRNALIERANEADRKIYRLKRQAFKEHEEGRTEEDILADMARARVRCPALDAQDQCVLFDVRPLTCRIYGVPTVIGGKAHTCGISGFDPGQSYPTVKLDLIYQRLYEISFGLAQALQSGFPKLHEVLVPLSMALLTEYTEEYLGVNTQAKSTQEK